MALYPLSFWPLQVGISRDRLLGRQCALRGWRHMGVGEGSFSLFPLDALYSAERIPDG